MSTWLGGRIRKQPTQQNKTDVINNCAYLGDYNPGGRMPVTTVTGEKDLPVVQDYNMSTPPGRTYR